VTDTITGSSRHISTTARIAFSRHGGSYVRAASVSAGRLRSRIGGLPSQEEPRLAFGGAGSSGGQPGDARLDVAD
jgi:hypothetical protein